MSPFSLHNISISARRHSVVCLLLFVLSLFSTVMATNSMMASASMMNTMEGHQMSGMSFEMNDTSSTSILKCASGSSNPCFSSLSDHNHQNCMDNHCSSFSGLLVSYASHSENASSIQVVLEPESYVSAYPNTPYIPPIFVS